MPASLADSALHRDLFGDPEVSALFSDAAVLRAMLLVEGTLARVQGELGLIPAEAAALIDRASREVLIDPAALAADTARNGVPVPALLAAFRKAGGPAEQMQYLHWGATSQDIMDTALALRLRRVLLIWDQRIASLLEKLAGLAAAHADLPMVARTYGQAAIPTSFGAVVAGWGWPLLDWRKDLSDLRQSLPMVSLSGAAGTLSAMGDHGPEVRARLAQALDLKDPGRSWHSDRSSVARLAGLATGLAGTLGKMAEDLLLLSQSGLAELSLGGGGGSSTMPQKENPVAPSALLALARMVLAFASPLQASSLHRQQRDGAAWFTEWLALPQLCIFTSRALSLSGDIATRLAPVPEAMRRNLDADKGLIYAEALTFALADRMQRPEAEATVKALCREAMQTGAALAALANRDFLGTDWYALLGESSLGQAVNEAKRFSVEAAGATWSGGGQAKLST